MKNELELVKRDCMRPDLRDFGMFEIHGAMLVKHEIGKIMDWLNTNEDDIILGNVNGATSQAMEQEFK
jgi:hypothetical protein